MTNIPQNIETITKKIHKAERGAGREEGATRLIAVSKNQNIEDIKAVITAGQKLFGENRVQEAHEHWRDLKNQHPDIQLHLIGPLQTNKVADAVSLFDCIQTLDREKLADALAAEMKKQNKNIPCFVQVNTGLEEQKAGIAPKDLKDFLNYCKKGNLNIIGLMCIPPIDEPAGLHFAFLKNLADQHGLKELSMGMSADFETAIIAGATYVRVGSLVFSG